MIKKIRDFIQKTFGKAPAKGSMIVVWAFAVTIIVEIIAYNAGWLYNWHSTAPKPPILRRCGCF